MATEWYYARDGQQKGPIAPRELKQLAQNGALRPTDLVWKDGMAEWKPAAQIPGLLPNATTQPKSDFPEMESAARRRRSRSVTGLTILCFSSLIMIAAACVPWWSMTIRAKDDGDYGGYWMRRDGLAKQAAILRVMPQSRRNGSRTPPRIRLRNARDDEGNWAETLASYMKLSERNLKNYRSAIEDSELESGEKGAADVRSDALLFFRVAEKNKKWWDRNLKSGDKSFGSRFRDLASDVDRDDKMSLTIRLWGISNGRGVMGLVFGIMIFVFSLVFALVPVLRNWGWIVSLVATIMGVVAFTLALIWIAYAPSGGVGSMFRQGTSFGPYLLLASGFLFLLVGMLDSIFGISYLIKLSRIRSA